MTSRRPPVRSSSSGPPGRLSALALPAGSRLPEPVHAFRPCVWDIPERFNIGAACTDAHLGTPVAARAAVIVDDDAAGVRQATFAELAAATSRFAELLRQLGIACGARVLVRLPNCSACPTASRIRSSSWAR